MKNRDWMEVLLFCAAIVASIAYLSQLGLINELYKDFELTKNSYSLALSTYNMCNSSFKIAHQNGFTGFYRANSYYCVWVGNETLGDLVRGSYELKETEIHENCHHLVYLDREHFCAVA